MSELILALDLPDAPTALQQADELRGIIRWCKVGSELFTLAGPPLVHSLRDMGFDIFLDLKFYDIPHTVARAVTAAASTGAAILSLHCQGGRRMCRAARDAALAVRRMHGFAPLLFGVTVLTSFDDGEMPGISLAPSAFAQHLAFLAKDWGLDGVICSAREAGDIKKASPGLSCLCPGIRPVWAPADDQRRIVTPAEAVATGADYLVVGRPILEATDKIRATQRILAEMSNQQD